MLLRRLLPVDDVECKFSGGNTPGLAIVCGGDESDEEEAEVVEVLRVRDGVCWTARGPMGLEREKYSTGLIHTKRVSEC